MDKKTFAYGAYEFNTAQEAEAAKKEDRGIKIIRQKMDLSDAAQILRLYNKLIEEEYFSTPEGYFFLKDLREYLMLQPGINKEEIKNIKVKKQVVIKEVYNRQENKAVVIENNKKINYKERSRKSIILNVGLVIVIVAMFIINLTSNNVNIINYRNKIINQYEEWEQSLIKREEEIKKLEEKYKNQ